MKFHRLRRSVTAIALSVLVSMPLLLAGEHIHDLPGSEVSCDYCSFPNDEWVDARLEKNTIETVFETRRSYELIIEPVFNFYRRKPRGPPFLC